MKMKIYYNCKITYTFNTYILAKEETDDKFSEFYLTVVEYMTKDKTKKPNQEQGGSARCGIHRIEKTDIAKCRYNFWVNENLFHITPEGKWQRYV